MMMEIRCQAVLALLIGTLLAPATVMASLGPGDEAPPLSATDTEGEPVELAELLERGPVVLAFFPKAFTGG